LRSNVQSLIEHPAAAGRLTGSTRSHRLGSAPLIIADPEPRPAPERERLARLVGFAAIAFGACASWVYYRAGLTLSHYDAKAHLVVARRVIDSLTPGWQQIGAVWLPLPHLLNLLPVQIDAFYRTGASAVALSVLSFGLIAYACARLVMDVTRSRVAAIAGTAVVVLNPDLLYLQSTPMTEPLLLGLSTLAVALLVRWVDTGADRCGRAAGLAFAGACLTRYEAWPLTAISLAAAAVALWRRGGTPRAAISRVARIAAFPCAAGLAFLALSRLTVGHWFVTGGFYVVDNPDMGRPFKTAGSIWWASHKMNGYGVVLAAVAGGAALAFAAIRSRARSAALVVLALGAAAALPWYAFVVGHPFRFRYMVPLVPALAVWAGIGVGLTGRLRVVAAAGLIGLVVVETRPFDFSAPMVVEAQLDRVHSVERREVTAYLAANRRGEKILASLGSLSHYVQELSAIGVRIRDVVHEGNGDLWAAAIERPDAHVGWVLVEELAEGGDHLAALARENPAFLRNFRRVAAAGGVALYRRTDGPRP
jgi:hypothetical protein